MKIDKAAGALGAYINDISLAEAGTSADLFAAIDEALLEYEVLFFPNQHISPIEFQTLARRFGSVLGHPAYPRVVGAEDVQILESTADEPSKIEKWHSDMTFSATPPAATLLHGQIIPKVGGDTLWASASAAYDALSQPMQSMLGEMTALHDFRWGFQESLAEPGGRERLGEAIAKNPPVAHPVIRTHPRSGRKAIYVNGLFTAKLEGVSALESEGLLKFLYRHIVTEELTVRLSWQPQTLVIWDNCVTQHKPVNDYFPQHRKLHRITIAGGAPA